MLRTELLKRYLNPNLNYGHDTQHDEMACAALHISDEMRKLRKDADITLRGLARELGISAPYLVDMEMGKRRYLEKHVDAVLKILQP